MLGLSSVAVGAAAGPVLEAAVGLAADWALSARVQSREDLQVALRECQQIGRDIDRLIRYLTKSAPDALPATERQTLARIATGLPQEVLGRYAVHLQHLDPTPAVAFLDHVTLGDTKASVFRVTRNLAVRIQELQDDARIVLAQPEKGESVKLRGRLVHLLRDLRELQHYYAELPGLKVGTKVALRSSLLAKVRRRTALPPLSVPAYPSPDARQTMVERLVHKDSLRMRLQATVRTLKADLPSVRAPAPTAPALPSGARRRAAATPRQP